MQQIEIGENEAGQRLDKFLHKFMPLAQTSFFYKMLRKKNITLNGKKAEGKEKLKVGDQLSLFLSDETISGFQEAVKKQSKNTEYRMAYQKLKGIMVIYEDEQIVIMNKPAGILSQKAEAQDLSLNEWLIGYLLENGSLEEGQLATYKPSVCNRLDRNTIGLVIGAKTLKGSQKMNELISSRRIRKFYRMFVKGSVRQEELLEGYLIKDEKNNKVRLVQESDGEKTAYIKTRYYPVKQFGDKTLVEAELITGKPHQIRIHLSGAGHPLLGDYKYGHKSWNDSYKQQFRISSQMLYACRLEFPEMEAPFEKLSGKILESPVPKEFQLLMKAGNTAE